VSDTYLDHASLWLNGKVEEASFLWWSQNWNPPIRTAVRKGEDGKVCDLSLGRSFLSSQISNESHVLNTYWIVPRFGSMER